MLYHKEEHKIELYIKFNYSKYDRFMICTEIKKKIQIRLKMTMQILLR